jgi:hypothetical protein
VVKPYEEVPTAAGHESSEVAKAPATLDEWWIRTLSSSAARRSARNTFVAVEKGEKEWSSAVGTGWRSRHGRRWDP